MARPSDLERKGTPIGGYDGPIAGQARSHGLVVVNANLTVFERVAGLSCEAGLELETNQGDTQRQRQFISYFP
jgi:hypothetical protein